jgi:hypothetical protein
LTLPEYLQTLLQNLSSFQDKLMLPAISDLSWVMQECIQSNQPYF